MGIPIFLFNGLLESGKTTFIHHMLEKSVFNDGKATVVICCEEGVEAYDEVALSQKHITVVTLDEENELTKQRLKQVEKEIRPERVLIEYNGMWDITRLFEIELPKDWFIYQVISIVNAATYRLYIQNMRALMITHFRYADLILANRNSDEVLTGLTGIVKSVNTEAKLYTVDEDFQLEPIQQELPYDLKQEVIDISKDNYGIWYIDIWEHPEHYEGKMIKVRGLFFREATEKATGFTLGRFAMPCCAEDIALMGVYCVQKEAIYFENKQSIELVGVIKYQKLDIYQGTPGPVIYTQSIRKVQESQEELIVFN